MQSIIPVVMAGILGIYGIIVCISITGGLSKPDSYKLHVGYKAFGAGLIIGLSCLASGLAIGVAGDATVRAYAQTGSMFVIMIMIMIFAECIALYGLIISIIIVSSSTWEKSYYNIFLRIFLFFFFQPYFIIFKYLVFALIFLFH